MLRLSFTVVAVLLVGCGEDPQSLAMSCRVEALKAVSTEKKAEYIRACMGAKGFELENDCWLSYNIASPHSGEVPDYCFEKRGSFKQMWRNLGG